MRIDFDFLATHVEHNLRLILFLPSKMDHEYFDSRQIHLKSSSGNMWGNYIGLKHYITEDHILYEALFEITNVSQLMRALERFYSQIYEFYDWVKKWEWDEPQDDQVTFEDVYPSSEDMAVDGLIYRHVKNYTSFESAYIGLMKYLATEYTLKGFIMVRYNDAKEPQYLLRIAAKHWNDEDSAYIKVRKAFNSSLVYRNLETHEKYHKGIMCRLLDILQQRIVESELIDSVMLNVRDAGGRVYNEIYYALKTDNP